MDLCLPAVLLASFCSVSLLAYRTDQREEEKCQWNSWEQCHDDITWILCHEIRMQCNETWVRHYCRRTCAEVDRYRRPSTVVSDFVVRSSPILTARTDWTTTSTTTTTTSTTTITTKPWTATTTTTTTTTSWTPSTTTRPWTTTTSKSCIATATTTTWSTKTTTPTSTITAKETDESTMDLEFAEMLRLVTKPDREAACNWNDYYVVGEQLRCFIVHNGMYTFESAYNQCKKQGKRLVWLDDEGYRAHVQKRCRESNSHAFWMGMKKNKDDKWYWYDGDYKKPVRNFYWRASETKMCCGCGLSRFSNSEWMWDDAKCDLDGYGGEYFSFVCEWIP